MTTSQTRAQIKRVSFGILLALASLGCRAELPVETKIAPPSETNAAAPLNATNVAATAVAGATGPPGKVEPVNSGQAAEIAQASSASPQAENRIAFRLGGAENGIQFTRYDHFTPQHSITESTGGGTAILDYDLDGWQDVLLLDGCSLEAKARNESQKSTCALFRNAGQRKFLASGNPSGLMPVEYCQGVTVGDIDCDGFPDLYITAIGQNSLWRNNGDGTFANITDAAGVQVPHWSTGCAFADLNRDGLLDLYVVNYLNESLEQPKLCPNSLAPGGFEQCPPSKYEGLDDVVFMATGDGRFEDRTTEAGMRGLKGKGLGVVISDFDRDQWPEIYVANDGQANFLFVAKDSLRKATKDTLAPLAYDQRGMTAGCALSRSGYAQASMGVAAGDYDGNGTVDLFLTHFYGDSNTTYLNRGKLRFEDVTRATGMNGASRKVLGWGTAFADFDHDGWLDLFVANGHVEDRTWAGKGEPYAMDPHLFVNDRKGSFQEVSKFGGEYFAQQWLGRGVASGDLDRDGRLDLVVNHQLRPSAVLWNETQGAALTERPGVCIKLVGRSSNRDGLGCQVELLSESGEVVAYREVVGGASYLSASSYEVHLACEREKSWRIRIAWPDGRQEDHLLGGALRCCVIEERGIICL